MAIRAEKQPKEDDEERRYDPPNRALSQGGWSRVRWLPAPSQMETGMRLQGEAIIGLGEPTQGSIIHHRGLRCRLISQSVERGGAYADHREISLRRQHGRGSGQRGSLQ